MSEKIVNFQSRKPVKEEKPKKKQPETNKQTKVEDDDSLLESIYNDIMDGYKGINNLPQDYKFLPPEEVYNHYFFLLSKGIKVFFKNIADVQTFVQILLLSDFHKNDDIQYFNIITSVHPQHGFIYHIEPVFIEEDENRFESCNNHPDIFHAIGNQTVIAMALKQFDEMMTLRNK